MHFLMTITYYSDQLGLQFEYLIEVCDSFYNLEGGVILKGRL